MGDKSSNSGEACGPEKASTCSGACAQPRQPSGCNSNPQEYSTSSSAHASNSDSPPFRQSGSQSVSSMPLSVALRAAAPLPEQLERRLPREQREQCEKLREQQKWADHFKERERRAQRQREIDECERKEHEEREQSQKHEQSTAGVWGPSRRKWQPPVSRHIRNSQKHQQHRQLQKPEQPQESQPTQKSTAGHWGPSRSSHKWQPPAPRHIRNSQQHHQRQQRQQPQERQQSQQSQQPQQSQQSTAGRWGPSTRQWQNPAPQRLHRSQQQQSQPLEMSEKPEHSTAGRWGPSRRQWQPPVPQRTTRYQELQTKQLQQSRQPEGPTASTGSQEPVAALEPVTKVDQEFAEVPTEAPTHTSAATSTNTELHSPISGPPTFIDQILKLLRTTLIDLAAAKKDTEPRKCQNSTSETTEEPDPEEPEASSFQQAQTSAPQQTQPRSYAKPYTSAGAQLEAVEYFADSSLAWRWFAYIKEHDDPEFPDKGEHYTGILRPDITFADLSSFESAMQISVPGSMQLDEDYLQEQYTIKQIRTLLRTKKSEQFAKTWVHPYWTSVTRPHIVIDESVVNDLSDDAKFCMEASYAIIREPNENGEPSYYRYQQHTDAKTYVIKLSDSIAGVPSPQGCFFGPIPSQVYLVKPLNRWVKAGPHDLSGPYSEDHIPWYDDDMDDEESDLWYGPSREDRVRKQLYHDRRHRRKIWVVEKQVFLDREPGYRQVPAPWYER